MKKILLFLIFVSCFISFFLNAKNIEVPYFGGLYKDVGIDLTLKNDNIPDIFIDNILQKNILKIDNRHYLIKHKKYSKIKKIEIKNPENIEKIFIYNGNNIEFPKIDKEIYTDNSKDFISCFTVAFLSLFYNPWFYIIPYILLFIYLIKYGFNFNKKLCIPVIFLLAFIFRISSLNAIPFWDDEIYSIVIANSPSFLDVFKDPGNPPLYFALFKLYRHVVNNEQLYRFFPVILGLLFSYIFFIWLKKCVSEKTANVGLFLSAINIIMIYFSQELRCYLLLMILGVLNANLLFGFKKNNRIYYFFSSLALLYTHFYGAILFLFNFIFGLFYLSKKRIKNFILVNGLSFMLFIPLLIFKKESISSDFNSWMDIPNKTDYFLVFETFSGRVLMFLLFVVMAIFMLLITKKRKIKTFLIYNFFSFLFVFAGAILFTYLIKPIFMYRYFYIIYPMYLAMVSYISSFKYKYKYSFILSFIIIFAFGLSSRLNKQNLYCNHNLFLKFVKHEINNSENNYIFMTDTVKGYDKFENLFKNTNAKIKYLVVNKGINDINPPKEVSDLPFTAYVLNLYLKEDAIEKAKSIDLYKTNLGVYLKVKYE